jgi:opacity protein-like surface antigen
LIPVASRIGVGLRYFFTDNLGANLGLGFGQGGLINVGISAKF